MIDYAAGVGSAVVVWAAFRGKWWAPWAGLAVQAVWLAYCWQAQAWGLLPAVILYTAVYGEQIWRHR